MAAPSPETERSRNARPRSSSPIAHSTSFSPPSPSGSSGLRFDAVMNPSKDMLMSKTTVLIPTSLWVSAIRDRRTSSAVQERGRPRDGAGVPSCQQPATVPLHEHHGRPEFAPHVVALESAGLPLASRGHRRIPVDACFHLFDGEGLVGEATREPSQPLLFGQHEA